MKLNDHQLLEEAYKKVKEKDTDKKKKDEEKVEKLAKQDPREVEGYSKSEESDTYEEAHDINIPNLKGKEWHGLSAKTPEGPSMKELLNPVFKKKMQDVNLGGGMKKSMPEYSLANSIVSALEEHGDVSYDKLAQAVAEVLKDQYGSHNFIPFLTALNRELKTSRE